MPSAFALVAVLLSAPAGNMTSPLAGCTASRFAERGWQYDCKGFAALIEDWTQSLPQGYLDAVQKGVGILLDDDEPIRSRELRRIGGAYAEVQRSQARKSSAAAEIVALPRIPGVRVISCVVLRGGVPPCDAILNFLASRRWRAKPPAEVARGSEALMLAGQPMLLPVTCEGRVQFGVGGGHVQCPPIFTANWTPLSGEAQGRRVMDAHAEMIASTFSSSFSVTRDEVRCALAGVETSCGRALLEGKRQRLIALWAIARPHDEWLFANCIAADTAPMGPPCSLLFSRVRTRQ